MERNFFFGVCQAVDPSDPVVRDVNTFVRMWVVKQAEGKKNANGRLLGAECRQMDRRIATRIGIAASLLVYLFWSSASLKTGLPPPLVKT